jgi:uncharacterized protein YutE (UPF0331/DUF86 family)
MNDLTHQLRKADRLRAITQRVGFALWQLQELEGTSAQYFVLVAQAKQGMGLEAGNALVDDAQSKTFGKTITKLVRAKHLPEQVESRFQALVAERNWLVHNSRATSRNAMHDDEACGKLTARLDQIAEEAHLLLKEVGKCAEAFVKKYGVSTAKIDELAAETLNAWHKENAP